MGGALLQCWLGQFSNIHFDVVAPSGLDERFRELEGITHHVSIPNLIDQSDLIVLGVKPQILPDVLPVLKPLIKPDQCVLSLAAGRSMVWIGDQLLPGQSVVRVIPNMPCMLGKGASVGCFNHEVTEIQKSWVDDLFNVTGFFDWIEEDLFDVVTAVSGSGPAYVYYLVEAFEKSMAASGLPMNLIKKLVRQTVIGAAAMLDDMDLSPRDLRAQVTSKAGTTEAGLKVLMDGRLDNVLRETIEAAAMRSRELQA